MPSFRPQQPTTRNRRIQTIAQPADRQQIQWTLTRESAHRVSIELRSPQTGLEADFSPLVIMGAPALRVNDTLPTWTLTDLTATSFALECPEDLPEAGLWLLRPYDPAVRSSLGGFLVPKLTEINFTPPVNWIQATILDSNTIRLVFADVVGSILTSPIGHSWTPLGIPTTFPVGYGAIDFYATANTEAVAVFTEDITAESGLSFANPGMVVSSTGQVCAAGDLFFS